VKDIYFFIGTKAQAIKCLPLINKSLETEDFNVFIVDSGQHVEIVEDILKKTNNPVQKISVFKNTKNISTFKESLKWLIYFIFNFLFKKSKQVSNTNSGLCIVHGDTLSTLLGLLWGKKNKLDILHLESGLTSYKLFQPFPEEIIRRIVSKFSDILICFDNEAFGNLNTRFKDSKKEIKRVSENTIIETIDLDNNQILNNIATVTLHRTENIISKKKLNKFVEFLDNVSKTHTINWYLHEPTRNYLNKFNITISETIKLFDLLEHNKFLDELKKSDLIITDGGSIQEECYFLGKKTIIWRKTTERRYALNNNMFVSGFDSEEALKFISSDNFKIEESFKSEISPSQEIIDYLIEI
tara:strand:+ start:575 stop:1639 length:1065 start_codon:yes stop_codon:yes gene_type:complete